MEITDGAVVSTAIALAAELWITRADTILVLPGMLTRDPVSALWTG